jgi:hypothetical protein
MRGVDFAMEGVRLVLGNRGLMLARLVALSTMALSQRSAFSASDTDQVQRFWNEPGRFMIQAPPERSTSGPWVVRLSPEGSVWFGTYNAARGVGKKSTLKAGAPPADIQKVWDAWLGQKVNYDRYRAGESVAEANSRYLGRNVNCTIPKASDPGPEPEALRQFVGVPPSFAAAVVPNQYLVNFPDGSAIKIADNPPMRANFPAYRFPQGVMSAGTPVKSLPPEQVDDLFNSAGVSGSTEKIMKAVSILEGGFDSVNTYDTGFVSVGLIQFACLSGGAGSLGMVLAREKQNDRESFENDFKRYGLDVTYNGALVALDIENGVELTGPAAARQIINDKRLVAVFQHAGQTSRAFRIAQIQIAKEQYFPGDDAVAFNADGQTVHCKVADCVRSEAGLAILMDRKVNTGKIDPLANVLTQVATETGCKTPEDLAAHEREIILACRYRKDYTQDPTLTQPGEVYSRPAINLASRHGTRNMRRGIKKKKTEKTEANSNPTNF